MGKRKRAVTCELDFGRGKHGGKRVGAGRKKRSREVHHAKREEFAQDSVIHVTIGFREGLVNLRRKKEARAIWRAFFEFREKGAVAEEEFRLLQMSIQRDHLHLGVEANSLRSLSNAMQRLKQRIQSALQRLWKLAGSLYRGRYHMRVAKTPTEVRRMLAYVLGNGRHHGVWKHALTDPFSTASAFEGWHETTRRTPPVADEPILSRARSWLARTGWKRAGRKGPLHYTEVRLPRGAQASASPPLPAA